MVVIALNFCQVTTISRWLLATILFICALYYAQPFFLVGTIRTPHVYAGPYLALAATAAALVLNWASLPVDQSVARQRMAPQANPRPSFKPSPELE